MRLEGLGRAAMINALSAETGLAWYKISFPIETLRMSKRIEETLDKGSARCINIYKVLPCFILNSHNHQYVLKAYISQDY